ncbi:MAG: 30S ribosomal protein S30, partial [Desulfobulbaceae bacterium]|nr:30S ribosomal protein S30 [Desulfobulbaceae bacterium]
MQVPLQITFRNMESSEAVETDVRKRVDKMNRRHAEIISCRVVVEAP